MSSPYYTPPAPDHYKAPISTPKRDGGLSRAAFRAYLILRDEASHADALGWLTFSPTILAAMNELPRSAMFRGLNELAQRGHIERGRRGRLTTARFITPGRSA